jgi:hypothetical protein
MSSGRAAGLYWVGWGTPPDPDPAEDP